MRLKCVVTALIVLMLGDVSIAWAQAPALTAAAADQEQAVRTLVGEFGKRLGQVSVLAPVVMAATAMDKAYAGFVAPDLLEKWKQRPQQAPGKQTSSPSPERIDIVSVTPNGRDAFQIVGKVILLTAKERRDGGVFQANPVTMTVARRGTKWLIVAYKETQSP